MQGKTNDCITSTLKQKYWKKKTGREWKERETIKETSFDCQ